MEQMNCPQCGSDKTRYIEKAGIYYCKECDHEFSPPGRDIGSSEKDGGPTSPPKKLRIFLSYGHDRNEELVRRIKTDLDALGHDVWIDKEEIKFGNDWRRAITDGISGSNLMLSFLSKHSTRDPGVCLDELSIALGINSGIVQTILVETEKEVLPPVSVSHIQWLDMHDWKDHWDNVGKSPLPDGWYKEKLSEIIRVIESDISYRFSGEIEELKKQLLPVTSDARIGWLLKQGFEGRIWLAEDINGWRLKNTDSRVFFLTGKPGVGKSAFAAWLAHQNKSNVIAAHFIEYNKSDRKDPRRIITSLAFQIATRLPDYRKFLMGLPELDRLGEKSAAELFSYLLVEPLNQAIEGGRERYAIIIDALDEASDDANNSIVDIIAQETEKLPQWITFIITSRPNPDIMRRLSGLSPIELAADDGRNRQDLSEFIRHWIERHSFTLKDPEEATNGIVSASEGNFLYLRKFCEWVEDKGWIDIPDSKTYPKGMTGMYQLYFKRQFPDIESYEKYQVPLLELVVAAYEPLPESLAEQVLGWKGRERIKVLDSLGSLFQRQDGRMSPFHKSVKDWLINPNDAGDYYIPDEDGHSMLADHGWNQFKENAETVDSYHLAWLPKHLGELKEYKKLTTLLKDFNYMMAKLKAGMLEKLLEDYRETIKTLPMEQRKALQVEQAFFREKAHILRRGNEEWPSYKIFLQLAIEHADDSPLTIGAEKFLADGKCNWIWLRRERRIEHVGVDPCIAVFEGHTSSVSGALSLPDGRILSWSVDYTLRLWNCEGNPLAILVGHTRSINGVLLFPDVRILSWSDDKTLRIWDSDGNPLKVLAGHTDYVSGALSLSDGRILSWSRDKTFRLWDSNGKSLGVLQAHSDDVFGPAPLTLPGGRILSWSDRILRLWNEDGKNFHILEGHKKSINGFMLLPDERILSWSNDKTLRLWDSNGKFLAILEGHTDWVTGAIWLPSDRILSWSHDKTLRLWDSNGKSLAILEGHTDWVTGALVLKCGQILTWSSDNTLRLWSRDGKPLAIFEGHKKWITGVLELRNGHILSCSDDKTLRFWDSKGKHLATFEGHSEWVRGILELDDRSILSWSGDNTLRLWDGDGELLAVLNHTEIIYGTIHGVLLLPDGRILSWSGDGTLRIWENDGKFLSVLAGHTDEVYEALSLPDGRILSWSRDKTIRLWDRDGTPLAVLAGHTDSIEGVKLLLDNRILSWSDDKTLRIWDSDGNPLKALEGHTDYVRGALSLSDGRVLSWSRDKTLRLWDSEGRSLAILEGHADWVTGAILLPSDLILSWSLDNTLRLWDGDGNPLKVLEGHTDYVRGALSLSDGRVLSWSKDKIYRLWKRGMTQCVVCALDEALSLYPELRVALLGEDCVFSHSHLGRKMNTIVLRGFGKCHVASVCWQGMDCDPRILKPDGTMIVTQANGQVCFLRVYYGNRRVTIEEMEKIVTTDIKNTFSALLG